MDNDGKEYILIGSGAGGAVIARELARAGKQVLIIEKGARHERFGFPLGFRLQHRWGGFRSREGVFISRGITVGGSTVIYNGNVYDPPRRLFDIMGIDFSAEAAAIKKEIGVRTLPQRFFERCSGGNRIREAAAKMGLPFEVQEKFIDPALCTVECDMCILGCPTGAKWTARSYVDDAVAKGAVLLASCEVDRILIENNRAAGVVLSDGRTIRGGKIIVAAGGIGTPQILLRSGIRNAGMRFFSDPMNIITGFADNAAGGGWNEKSFTHAIDACKNSEGFIIGNQSAITAVAMTWARWGTFIRNIHRMPFVKRGIGLFVKLADTPNGHVYADGSVSKPFMDIDRERMERGTGLAIEIMVRAGIRKKTITVVHSIAGHPGGSAAMGSVVDRNFRTEIEGLYVCDGSVIPESPGVPPALTIMAMAKYFAGLLLRS